MKASTNTSTLSKAKRDRLPFPIALYWLQACQEQDFLKTCKSAEYTVQALCALMMSDAVHTKWPDAFKSYLRGGTSGRELAKPSFGKRIELLRHIVGVHATVENPMLQGVQAWHDAIEPILDELVQNRNKHVHKPTHPLTELQMRQRLGTILTKADFLDQVQLLQLQDHPVSQRGQFRAQFFRLRGAGPHRELPFSAKWSNLRLDKDLIYLVSIDGRRWQRCPFFEPSRVTNGIRVWDRVDRRTELQTSRIDLTDYETQSLQLLGQDWRPVTWSDFVEDHQVHCADWRNELSRPHSAMTCPPPAAHLDRLKPGQRIGRNHVLVQQLGEGGSAVVWEAQDTDYIEGKDSRCALKVLKPEVFEDDAARERFEQEIRTHRRLIQRGCTTILQPIHDFRESVEGEVREVIRMPLMQGSLKDVAKDRRDAEFGEDPSQEQVSDWLRQGLEALVEIHREGVIHRDIKPSNFLVDEDRMVLADLGIAKDTLRHTDLTQTYQALGTQKYMAPEQIRAREVTPKADVFSLGVAITELWTGNADPSLDDTRTGPLAALLTTMMAPEPEDRPSAKEALQKLNGASAPRKADPRPDHPASVAPSASPEAAHPPSTPPQSGMPDHSTDSEALDRWLENLWWTARDEPLGRFGQKKMLRAGRAKGLADADMLHAMDRHAQSRRPDELQEVLDDLLKHLQQEGSWPVTLQPDDFQDVDEERRRCCISKREAQHLIRQRPKQWAGLLSDESPSNWLVDSVRELGEAPQARRVCPACGFASNDHTPIASGTLRCAWPTCGQLFTVEGGMATLTAAPHPSPEPAEPIRPSAHRPGRSIPPEATQPDPNDAEPLEGWMTLHDNDLWYWVGFFGDVVQFRFGREEPTPRDGFQMEHAAVYRADWRFPTKCRLTLVEGPRSSSWTVEDEMRVEMRSRPLPAGGSTREWVICWPDATRVHAVSGQRFERPEGYGIDDDTEEFGEWVHTLMALIGSVLGQSAWGAFQRQRRTITGFIWDSHVHTVRGSTAGFANHMRQNKEWKAIRPLYEAGVLRFGFVYPSDFDTFREDVIACALDWASDLDEEAMEFEEESDATGYRIECVEHFGQLLTSPEVSQHILNRLIDLWYPDEDDDAEHTEVPLREVSPDQMKRARKRWPKLNDRERAALIRDGALD